MAVEKAVDLTPTWRTTMEIMLMVLAGTSDPKARSEARREILRAGELLDKLQETENGRTQPPLRKGAIR